MVINIFLAGKRRALGIRAKQRLLRGWLLETFPLLSIAYKPLGEVLRPTCRLELHRHVLEEGGIPGGLSWYNHQDITKVHNQHKDLSNILSI